MRFALLNQFVPPARAPTGRLLADLAGELARRGHAATVIASAGGYGAASGAEPDLPGVRVIRTGPDGLHPGGLGGKLGDYVRYLRGAWRELSDLEAPDALVVMTTPPFLGLLGAQLRKTKGIPYVLWCMDLYPEALAAHGWLRPWNPLTPLLRALAREERGRAAAVVALGPDMADRLTQSGARRVEEIPVWNGLRAGPAEQAAAKELRAARGWSDAELVLMYSGNMGRAHMAEPFAALAGRLRQAGVRHRMVFAGAGPRRREWARQWSGLFEFLPPVPESACAAHLLAADVLLISQRPEWTGIVVPSKYPAACAVGRPVVVAGPAAGAVGRWLAADAAGWLLPPGDEAALAAAARGVADPAERARRGAQARTAHARRFAPDVNGAQLADLLESLGGRSP